MPRKNEKRVNLVRPISDEYYTPMENWQVVALGDRVRIEDAKSYDNGKFHVTYYVRVKD